HREARFVLCGSEERNLDGVRDSSPAQLHRAVVGDHVGREGDSAGEGFGRLGGCDAGRSDGGGADRQQSTGNASGGNRAWKSLRKARKLKANSGCITRTTP